MSQSNADLSVDVLVVGGGVGGIAAGMAAASQGATVFVSEEMAWVGGQLTSQAVPPDEHPWIERFGATASYRRYRELVREHYRSHYPLAESVSGSLYLNPGKGSVSAICHEPRVALDVLRSMSRRWEESDALQVRTRVRPESVVRDGERIARVSFVDLDSGEQFSVSAGMVLDATETGDLLPLAGVPYVTGTESKAQTGEPDAPDTAQPDVMQGFTICFAVDHLEGEDHTIDKPAQYDYWTAPGAPVRPAPQIGWPASTQTEADRFRRVLRPNPDPATDNEIVVSASATGRFDPPAGYLPVEDIWRFRRMLARGNLSPQPRSDITLINCSANDYIDGSIVDVPTDVATANLEAARQLSLSLVYWLQTEAPREDGGFGFPGIRLRGDVMGTSDGLAMAPYIREGRRIKALYTITQNDLARSVRGDAGAVSYQDSVGIGSYKIDLHPSTGGGERRYESAWPFEIPLGALLVDGTNNFIAAAKNIGTTHITNGCYRVHPVEWNIGEAAGYLAAYCVQHNTLPRTVRETPAMLTHYQSHLEANGIELHWPHVRAY